jgi:glycyl-tRNA synthetase beta chain
MAEVWTRKSEATPAAADAPADELLLEIGCEELPPRALDELRDALFAGVSAGLEREHIAFDAAASRAYSTPRRLAVLLSGVQSRQPDQHQERRGPSLAAAYDKQGQPTGAATGFARSLGLGMNELETLETDKGSWLVANIHVPGKPLDEIIFPVVEQALRQLPVPRPMRWADHDFSFVRPVHWLVLMHGSRVINGSLLGQAPGNTTRGHRIHAPGPHLLAHARNYVAVLRKARCWRTRRSANPSSTMPCWR